MPTFTSINSGSYKPPIGGDGKPKSLFGKPEEEQEQVSKKFFEDSPKWKLEHIILDKKICETVLDVITFCQNKDRLIEEWGLNNFLKGNSSIGIKFMTHV